MGEGPGKEEKTDEKPGEEDHAKDDAPTSSGLSTGNKLGLLLLVLTILVVTATHFAMKDIRKNAEAMRQGTSLASSQQTPPR